MKKYTEPKEQRFLRILKHIFETLNENIDEKKIPFLFAGTLLGFYRDNNICKGDGDSDIAILRENFDHSLIEKTLIQNGMTIYAPTRKNGTIKNGSWYVINDSNIPGVKTDLYILEDYSYHNDPNVSSRLKYWEQWRNYDKISYIPIYIFTQDCPFTVNFYPKELCKDIITKKWNVNEEFSFDVRVPKNIEPFLEIDYGKERWKTPASGGGCFNHQKYTKEEIKAIFKVEPKLF